METRTLFDTRINDLAANKRENSVIISKAKYDGLIADLKRIGSEGAKEHVDYFKRERYELRTAGGIEKLYKKNTNLKYACETELYDIIHTVHIPLCKVLVMHITTACSTDPMGHDKFRVQSQNW